MEPEKRIVLRRDQNGGLDDVVVKDVSMFRAELIHRGQLWLCCYLPGPDGELQQITFEVRARGKRLEFTVEEIPGQADGVSRAGSDGDPA